MPYVTLQQMFDEANARDSTPTTRASTSMRLTDGAIEVLTEHAAGRARRWSFVITYRLDGAYSEVGPDDTAYGKDRAPGHFAFLIAICPTPELLVVDRAWVRSLWDALQPHSRRIAGYARPGGSSVWCPPWKTLRAKRRTTR